MTEKFKIKIAGLKDVYNDVISGKLSLRDKAKLRKRIKEDVAISIAAKPE